MAMPLATYTGWALRAASGPSTGCEAPGQYIPFAKSKAERIASADPRPSIEERYESFGPYRSAVVNAVAALVKDCLLPLRGCGRPGDPLIDAGLAAGVPPPTGGQPKYPAVPHCN